jgi:hypothetical protein
MTAQGGIMFLSHCFGTQATLTRTYDCPFFLVTVLARRMIVYCLANTTFRITALGAYSLVPGTHKPHELVLAVRVIIRYTH